ncbi:MAG TPA: SMC-Scp complex subunit ScpB [Xanthomonadales bacterium]|nr:SMC-Scp complex subunit ScpB [Xanthomonadales bacterium]
MQPELVDTGKLQRDLEALLFVASEALSIPKLAKLTGADEPEVTLALQRIDEEFAHRGIVLREIAGGYRFASSPTAREAVEAYLMPPKTNLSPAALETLAIVAYTQPTTKGDIEGIRGVSADSVIATLVDRRFLTESGRKDVPGRPILYKTTAEFLEAFGLRSLEELPPVDVDGTSPVELALALPVQTILAPHEGETAVEATPDDDDGVLRDEAVAKNRNETPVGTTVAQETEPQPSPV